MNDDCDNYIIQKYRLAVAIAVIKNTPKNCTPKKYLEHLKNIILEMEPYDPDITLCEDDFNINDDDDDDRLNHNYKNDEAINGSNENNDKQLFDSQTNDSITILKDFDFNDMIQNFNNDIEENNSVSDVLKILKGVNDDRTIGTVVSCGNVDGNKFDLTQSTYYESSQGLIQQKNNTINENIGQLQDIHELTNIPINPEFENKNQMIDTIKHRKENVVSSENAKFYDSQITNTFQGYTDDFTQISQSQTENIILPKYLIQKEIPKDTKSKLSNDKLKQNLNAVNKTFENNVNGTNKIEQKTHLNNNLITIKTVKQVKENKKHKYATQEDNTTDNIQAKRPKNIDNIKPNTDTAFKEIKNKFDISSDTNSEITLNNNLKKGPNELYRSLFVEQDKTDSLQDFEKQDTNFNKTNTENDQRFLDNIESQTFESNNVRILYNSQPISQLSQDSEPSNIYAEATVEAISNSTKQNTTTEAKEREEQIIEDLFDQLTDSQAEVVPFKVLEELNKIKSYLNKRSRTSGSDCVSDSGYKSDSQSRSSFKSALQSSNIGLNQSAHCLLSYITRCRLAVNTEEINNDISKTLGRLIDKLHEDEKYPSFLDDHLQTINGLLQEIYKGESADQLLEKDENIHRLFLLNKSSHIIKYTTEKIITILEDLLTLLTNEELLETFRTIQIENLSYIFHILETLIKKLVVYRNFSSQHSTQNSQEDEMVLKRSSITDIWRKKWNPTKKSNQDPITSVKQCILVRCSDVLNKVIVEAMDGYSLISYFALQCFNLLQN